MVLSCFLVCFIFPLSFSSASSGINFHLHINLKGRSFCFKTLTKDFKGRCITHVLSPVSSEWQMFVFQRVYKQGRTFWLWFYFWFGLGLGFFWDTEHLWGSHKFFWLSVTAEIDRGLFYRLWHRAWSHQSPIKWITKSHCQRWALESPFTWDWESRFFRGLLARSTETGITTVNIPALFPWGETTLPHKHRCLGKRLRGFSKDLLWLLKDKWRKGT